MKSSLLLLASIFFIVGIMKTGYAQQRDITSMINSTSLEKVSSDPILLLEYLDAGGDANARTAGGLPLLTEACCGRSFKCVEMLIDAGADPNRSSKTNELVLLVAFVQTPDSMLRLLLNKGANPNILSKQSGNAVLHQVATGDYVSRIFGKSSNTPELLPPYEQSVIEKYAKKEEELLNFLVQKGANLRLQNSQGLTPLQIAKQHKIKRLAEKIEHLLRSQREQEKRANKTKVPQTVSENDTVNPEAKLPK